MIERGTGFSHNIQFVHESGPVLLRERPRVTLHGREPISLKNLVGSIPAREGIAPWPDQYLVAEAKSAPDLYATLALEPAQGFLVTNRDSRENEYLVVGPRFSGYRINALQYFAAPFKDDGFDAYDAHHHIHELLGDPQNADMQARLARHRRMKGWAEFEGSTELIRRTIHDYYFNVDRDTRITGVLRWRKNAQGQREIMLDPFKDGMKTAIAEAIQSVHPRLLDGGVGLLYLAAYSPDQTHWPERSGYSRAKKKVGQFVGPPQAMAFAFRRIGERQAGMEVADNEDLLQSPILAKWEQHLAVQSEQRAA